MAGVLICPPPGKTTAALFITNAVNHPNNTPGSIMVKESGEELDPSCCCIGADFGCCEFDPLGVDPIAPDPIFVAIAASVEACLNDTFELPLVDIDPPNNAGHWSDVFTICSSGNVSIDVQCFDFFGTGNLTYRLEIVSGFDYVISIPLKIVSCVPLHLTTDGTLNVNDYCTGASCPGGTISAEVTE